MNLKNKWHKLTALVVDDNDSDRLVVKASLQALGLKEIHVGENGSIAVNKIMNSADMGIPYDLVLIDWNMPSANGLKVLQALKASSKFKKTKIIMMTATSKTAVVHEAIENGAHDFLVKPITFEILSEKINRLFA